VNYGRGRYDRLNAAHMREDCGEHFDDGVAAEHWRVVDRCHCGAIHYPKCPEGVNVRKDQKRIVVKPCPYGYVAVMETKLFGSKEWTEWIRGNGRASKEMAVSDARDWAKADNVEYVEP
jgi:hypothetical protein